MKSKKWNVNRNIIIKLYVFVEIIGKYRKINRMHGNI